MGHYKDKLRPKLLASQHRRRAFTWLLVSTLSILFEGDHNIAVGLGMVELDLARREREEEQNQLHTAAVIGASYSINQMLSYKEASKPVPWVPYGIHGLECLTQAVMKNAVYDYTKFTKKDIKRIARHLLPAEITTQYKHGTVSGVDAMTALLLRLSSTSDLHVFNLVLKLIFKVIKSGSLVGQNGKSVMLLRVLQNTWMNIGIIVLRNHSGYQMLGLKSMLIHILPMGALTQ